jgi:hypothetical protein
MDKQAVVRVISKLVFYLLHTYGELIESWVDKELETLIKRGEAEANKLAQ